MKKIVISLLALAFLTGCINFKPKENEEKEISEEPVEVMDDPADDIAMRNSPHLKFKNVPIDGTLDKFVARMVRSGFSTEEKTTGQAILSGDFAGFKDCTVYVETLNGKDLVSRITVCFPEKEQWDYLHGDYKHLKELLSTKYGKPSSCIEKFQSSYGFTPTEDDDKMYSVYNNNCKYQTRFVTNKGEIILWIGHGRFSHAFVQLAYRDKINGDEIKKHAIEDL